MPKLYALVLASTLALFLLLAAVEGGQNHDARHSSRPELVIDLAEQETTERTWRDVSVDSTIHIGNANERLLRPLQVVPFDGGLLVMDYGDMSVKEYNWSGQMVQAYGRSGRGPGEFANPTDVDVAGSTIWIADGGARRLTRITESSVETLPMEDGALRVAPVDRMSAFVMTSTPTGDGLFTRIQGRKSDLTFGRVIENQKRDAIALDGELEYHNGSMIYSSYYSGFILSYDTEGNLKFASKTLNHKNLPEVQVTRKGNATVRRVQNRDYVNAQMSVDENGIHLFSFKGSVEESALVIDTYSLKDGSYKYSTKAKEDIRRIRTFQNTHVGIENDTLVTAYWYSIE